MGAPDPRLNITGKLDFRIQRQLRSYSKDDPPPNRVKPIPAQVLLHLRALADAGTDQATIATADMASIAFYFLLRPGEYTGAPSDTTPFSIDDVQLWCGNQRLDLATCSADDLFTATFVMLTFTSQKNSVRGEIIGLGRSSHLSFCPVVSVARRILHLRTHGAPPGTPLASYFRAGTLHHVTPSDITAALQLSVRAIGPSLGFLATDISARSLRAGGAMALLCAQVDHDTIRLIGRWRSDEMLRYLHVQAEPVMRHFARKMLEGGSFTLLPHQDVPCSA